MQESKRAEVLQEQEQKRLASAPPRGQGDQVPSPLRPAPRGTHSGWSCAVPQSDLMFQRESAKGMGEDEEKFDDSIDVNQTYSWHDKYRPRKPRYFNRVHTGCAAADCAPLARAALSAALLFLQLRLEQVQPDALRPRQPPAEGRAGVQVQRAWPPAESLAARARHTGRRCAQIFYPDLIDRSKTPSYTLHPVEGTQDVCQIRFHAGPPYEVRYAPPGAV